MKIEFNGSFDSLRKDREGEVKLTIAVPLSDEFLARQLPIQTALKITVESEE